MSTVPNLKSPSPSLHEGMIERHAARDNGGRPLLDADPALAALRDAMARGRAAAEKARRVAEAMLRNEMETVPARHRRLRDESHKLSQAVLPLFDRALAEARRTLDDIERRTGRPPAPTGAAEVALAGEIRARLASMPPEKRRAALRQALDAGDDTLHAAALHGPAMLTGMEPAELEVLRATWREARHGAEMERARRLSAAVADAERGGSLLMTYTAGLANDRIIAEAERAERAVLEAIAG
ncbi:hypothetical protein [Methylopila sp. 73B]|uniref:hypothetical protein n=1 Tax=Methylopila sp. 73B TaxID=1120792 RepID=UPI00037F4234|nr:hypothetical protein [Methylopila sp. 73B]